MQEKIPFYRDVKVLGILFQVLFVVLVVLGFGWMFRNMFDGLHRQNLNTSFDFLKDSAGFQISEGIPFDPSESYAKAFWVGIVNTLRVGALGILFSTILGFIIGVSRISSNWLVNRLSYLYVEFFRNTPLLVQLFFLYYAVFLALPAPKEAIHLGNWGFLSNAGLSLPSFSLSGIEYPKMGNFAVEGGTTLTSEFSALLLGLVLYSSAFIGEIVRGAIQAIHKGQWEASRSLGLNYLQTLGIIIVPQALRIVIPPLGNQYLNIVKNSSLAIATSYPDLFNVAGTMGNQSGNNIQSMLLVIVSYLSMSLIISALINVYNRRFNRKGER